jgi:CRISPR-associated endonuclease/helicase Cas3
VVVLDEAQLLPPEFLTPVLHVLTELTKNYGVTLLLTTATQPAFAPRPEHHFAGLPGSQEIIPDPLALHGQLKRISLKLPANLNEPRTWEEIAKELMSEPSVLCVVNRRDDARTLWELMPEGTVHLSALMCGEHRSEKIIEIKQRLKAGLPTRVISTQLVEAGVDLDFPCVYRALAGLDSIAQAAGRCNREGLLVKGTVHVFIPPSQPPPGVLRQAEGLTRQLLAEDAPDHLAPDCFTRFFRELYWHQGDRLDKKQILADLCPHNEKEFRYSFRTAAEKFRMIDDSKQASVVVSYGKGATLINRLEQRGPDRELYRQLQRYVINLPRYLHRRLLESGAIRELHGVYVQGHSALYHEQLGFCTDKSLVYEPDDLVC